MTRPTRARRGFTLIELLVVVAIIALLISILLPSLRTAREQASGAACMSNLRQVMLGLSQYQDDSRGYLPSNCWSEYDWSVPKRDLWFYKLYPTYVADPSVYMCPGDPFRAQFDFEAILPPNRLRMNARAASCGYGLNYLLRHFREPISFNIQRWPPAAPYRTILLAEVGPDDAIETAPTGGAGMSTPWRDAGRIVWDDGARPWYSGASWLTARHNGYIMMGAMDYTVHKVRTREIVDAGPAGILETYPNCIAGDCYFCNYHPASAGDKAHYSFARSNLYWWTGRIPRYR